MALLSKKVPDAWSKVSFLLKNFSLTVKFAFRMPFQSKSFFFKSCPAAKKIFSAPDYCQSISNFLFFDPSSVEKIKKLN